MPRKSAAALPARIDDVRQSEIEGQRITRTPDGIEVEEIQPDEPRVPQAGDFDENLISSDTLSQSERRLIAERLIEYCAIDEDSRADWKNNEVNGLALLGVHKIPDENENSADVNGPGMSQVKYPALAEAVTRFNARAMAELFPAQGLVKVQIAGEITKDRRARADRVENYLNYHNTFLDKGYFGDTDQMLLYLPMVGSVFRKSAPDWVTGLPKLRHIKADDFVVPYSATSLEDAPRYCQKFSMMGQDVQRSVKTGYFADVDLKVPTNVAVKPRNSDKADGRTPVFHDDDAVYQFLEYHLDWVMESDEFTGKRVLSGKYYTGAAHEIRPYIIVVEETNQEVVMLRRNWRMNDPKLMKRIMFAHHKFFPGLGFYGWGYPHLLGTLAKGINDGFNACLDNAYALNFEGGFVTEEGRKAGMDGEMILEHGKFKHLNGTFEDIRKAIWTPEVKPAGPALSNLVTEMVGAFQRFAGTTESAVGDGDNKGPVGTTLALIEQSNIVPTGVHKRLHQTFGEEFQIQFDQIGEYMPNEYPFEYNKAARVVLKADFNDQYILRPVSDPNITSQTQRIAMCQGILELQARNPALYTPDKQVEAHRRMIEAMRVPDPDSVSPELKQPTPLDPVSENMGLLKGAPVAAFETQDHDSHMKIHAYGRMAFIAQAQQTGMPPNMVDPIVAAFVAHEREHMGWAQRLVLMSHAGIHPPPMDPNTGAPQQLPPDVESKLSALVAMTMPPPPTGGQDQGDGQHVIDKKTADLKAREMDGEAKIARDTAAFQSEEARKDAAFEKEQLRKDAEAAREAKRKELLTQVEAGLKAHSTVAEIHRKNVSHTHEIGRAEEKHDQSLTIEGARAGQQMQLTDKAHKQSLDHKNQAATIDGNIKGQKAKQERRLTDSKHKQATRHLDDKHSQTIDHTAKSHEQQLEQADAQHSQSQAQADASFQQQQEQAQASHELQTTQAQQSGELALSQTEKAGKLKLQQTKQQLKEKKAATKKKAGKKK